MQEKAITIQKLFDLLKSGEDLTKKNPVFIEGWVRTNRSSKSIGFIEVNDGSCFKCIQVVYEDKLANFADATHYLKPVFKGGAWYLGHEEVADPTLDPSIVWHITGAADGGYVMKNCGLQDSTYFRPLASGYSWGYVSMTGTSVSKQSFKNEYSNIYKIYTEGNNNFFNGDWGSGFNGGLITTNNDNHPLDGSWTLVKVADDAIPFMTALNEAITDAKGTVKDMQVGMNPGDKKGDTTAIMKVIREAEAMYAAGSASDDEVKAEIAKLKTASDEFLAQDHSEPHSSPRILRSLRWPATRSPCVRTTPDT